MGKTLLDRIGVDIGRRLPLEQAIDWAAERGVRYIDIQLDTGANKVDSFDDARCARIRAQAAAKGVTIGLHTLSAVNVAEYSPFLSEAVDAYMRAYIEVAPKLGAAWIVVHAGYHFTADVKMRMEAGLDRLQRMVAHAEKHGALLLLENLNKEPADAEVHYLAHSLEEWRYYYDRIDSPAFALSFTANHAHLMPDGVQGFVDAIPLERVAEVRLADCFRNGHEQHLLPGEGNFDFGAMFELLERRGFQGHYMNAFGTLDDMHQSRQAMVDMARTAGLADA
ncbi:sugar phosphate isomerase/epimerase [Roseomonas sp. 18066]|uniref:sugar phosphate isomerase/epimerase family protein n=1 Tax=Roseomonas sp. 18066 TaxID=2681412 RepID=UPI00135733D8|nr:TIM barrel protein [Roseomonas sp. 18066]